MGGTGDVQSQEPQMGLAGYMPGGGWTAMTGTFFALALLSALNPKLFAFDLVLIENARARLMFGCYPLGGMGIPFAFLGFRPEGTKGAAPARPGLADEPLAAAHRRRRYLRRAYMAISGLDRLLT